MRTRDDLQRISKTGLKHRVRDLEDERDGALDRMLAMENDLEDCVAVVHAVRRYRAGLLTYEALIAMVSEEADDAV